MPTTTQTHPCQGKVPQAGGSRQCNRKTTDPSGLCWDHRRLRQTEELIEIPVGEWDGGRFDNDRLGGGVDWTGNIADIAGDLQLDWYREHDDDEGYLGDDMFEEASWQTAETWVEHSRPEDLIKAMQLEPDQRSSYYTDISRHSEDAQQSLEYMYTTAENHLLLAAALIRKDIPEVGEAVLAHPASNETIEKALIGGNQETDQRLLDKHKDDPHWMAMLSERGSRRSIRRSARKLTTPEHIANL